MPNPTFTAAVGIGAMTTGIFCVLCGVVVLLYGLGTSELTARSRLLFSAQFGTGVACTTSILTAIAETVAVTYAQLTRHDFAGAQAASLILFWAVVGWVLGFVDTVRKMPQGTFPRTEGRPRMRLSVILFYSAVLVLSAILLLVPLATMDAVKVVAGVPLVGLGFMPWLQWWTDRWVQRHQLETAVAVTGFGVLLVLMGAALAGVFNGMS